MKYITVTNLTLDLWLDYVKPAFGDDVAPEKLADEITHCMTVACFNADRSSSDHAVNVRNEAVQMLYQMTVSAAYRHETKQGIIDLAAAMTKLLQGT